jgi:hypothetical protein
MTGLGVIYFIFEENLVDLAGIEPTISSMPWSDKAPWVLTDKDLLTG